jgi:hypothetical protein
MCAVHCLTRVRKCMNKYNKQDAVTFIDLVTEEAQEVKVEKVQSVP